MACSECNTCGGTLHWDWTEAFAKFGFGDGDGQVETYQVETVLVDNGYCVEVDSWGLHNLVITSIKKDDLELIPYDKQGYVFGYSDPRLHFPEDLVNFLDEHLPPLENYFYIW